MNNCFPENEVNEVRTFRDIEVQIWLKDLSQDTADSTRCKGWFSM